MASDRNIRVYALIIAYLLCLPFIFTNINILNTAIAQPTDYVGMMPSNQFWTGVEPNNSFTWGATESHTTVTNPWPQYWDWLPNCNFHCNPYGVFFYANGIKMALANLSIIQITNRVDKYSVSGYVSQSYIVNFTEWNHNRDSIGMTIQAKRISTMGGSISFALIYSGGGGKGTGTHLSYTYGNATQNQIILIDGASNTNPETTGTTLGVMSYLTSNKSASSYTIGYKTTNSLTHIIPLTQFNLNHKFNNQTGSLLSNKTVMWGGFSWNTSQTETVQIGIAATETTIPLTEGNPRTLSQTASTSSPKEERTLINSILSHVTQETGTYAGSYYQDTWDLICLTFSGFLGNGYRYQAIDISTVNTYGSAWQTDSSQVWPMFASMNLTQYFSNGIVPSTFLTNQKAVYEQIMLYLTEKIHPNLSWETGTIRGFNENYLTYLGNELNKSLVTNYNSTLGAYEITCACDLQIWDTDWTGYHISTTTPLYSIDLNVQNILGMKLLSKMYSQAYSPSYFKVTYWINQYNSHLTMFQSYFWNPSVNLYEQRMYNGTFLTTAHLKHYDAKFISEDNSLALMIESNSTRVTDIATYVNANQPYEINGGTGRMVYPFFSLMGMYRASNEFSAPLTTMETTQINSIELQGLKNGEFTGTPETLMEAPLIFSYNIQSWDS